MIVHLIDGTYELFRQFYGRRHFSKGKDERFGAVSGVLHSILEMIETGATHVGVATDHVIESFRNDLWPDYKTGEGIEPALLEQFQPLEESLTAMGVVVWPMIELEADDALASAAQIASGDQRVEKVCIWTPDKDLAQCVRGDRVVQVDRKGKTIRDAAGVREKFGVEPKLIPDFLALVGGAAPEPVRRDRDLSPSGARGAARPGIVVQNPGDAPDRCATLPRCGRAPVARAHRCLRRVDGARGRRPTIGTLPQDVTPPRTFHAIWTFKVSVWRR